MRTPGQDQELAAGFLYTEGVIRDSDDIDEVVEPAGDDTGRSSVCVKLAPYLR